MKFISAKNDKCENEQPISFVMGLRYVLNIPSTRLMYCTL